ncbi:putative integrase p49 (IN) [CHAIN 4], partial [Phytophthora infestans]
NEVIDGEVGAMFHDGVVGEGTGAWGFPVVLVRKKNGTKDVYSLLRLDEALETMHSACRLTTLDLHAGYWQVPVAEKDRDKTVFVTRQGLFKFVRMPFGLENAFSKNDGRGTERFDVAELPRVLDVVIVFS